MFIVTTKLSARKLLCGAAALAAGLLGMHVTTDLAGEVSALEALAAGSAAEDSTAQTGKSEKLDGKDDWVNYLSQCGWEADPDSCIVQEVMIPSDFDDTYQRYVQLQSQQGFDLEKYRGKRVKLVTYTVLDPPDGTELEANLLLSKNRVIAGDITNLADGGTAYGLMDDIPAAEDGNEEE